MCSIEVDKKNRITTTRTMVDTCVIRMLFDINNTLAYTFIRKLCV